MTENDTDRVWDLMPSERQPTKPPERPDIGRQPGSEPDCLPGSPSEPPGRR